LSDNGGEDAEFSIGSTLTLQDTDVVEQFIEGICIIIIGLIDDVSKQISRFECGLDDLVGPD
jgi:hypothetical protein